MWWRRFKVRKNNKKIPKPLIKINGKPFFRTSDKPFKEIWFLKNFYYCVVIRVKNLFPNTKKIKI